MSKEAKLFGEFLQRQREEKNVERDALGEGLLSANLIGKVERGERYPEKPVRDRLLARLGESGYDYECFLHPDEYEDWEARRDILDALDDLKYEKAKMLLEQYEEKHGSRDAVSEQFLLTMRVQWMESYGAPDEERAKVLAEAVKLTIPAIDTKPVTELLLSPQELNLVLEYGACQKPEKVQELCLQLLSYLENADFDMEQKAMLGAKLALFYCDSESMTKESKQGILEQVRQTEQALEICTAGIEKLRDHSKIYFAWELLQKKEQYLQWLLEFAKVFSNERIDEYRGELEQTKEFFRLIDMLYDRYQVPKETNGFTCFYREHEIYCINEVIRARRRMLDISAEELEQQRLCSRSTLQRLEKERQRVQLEIVQDLFAYLKLPFGLQRAQIVTDSQKAIRLEKEFRWAHNQREYGRAEQLLQQLKSVIPQTENINRQYILFHKKQLDFSRGEINKDEFLRASKDALEITVPIEVAMKEIQNRKLSNGRMWIGEKYLTNTEVTILYNIAWAHGRNGENAYWQMLKEYFTWLEKKCTLTPILGMYGLVMTQVASWLGNLGRYEESNLISNKIMKELLHTRNVNNIRGNLYSLLWNERMQKGLPMKKEDPEWLQGLLDCLTADVYCKDEWRASKMKKRLEM